MKNLLVWTAIAVISITSLTAETEFATYKEKLKVVEEVAEIAKKNPEKAAELADSIEDLSIRNKAYISLTNEWVKADPKAATEWALEIEGPVRFRKVRHLIRAWAEIDPEKAGEWAEILDSDPKYGYRACITLATTWIKKDPKKARSWVQSIQKNGTRLHTLEKIGWTMTDLQREEKLVASIKNQKDKDTALNWLARGWAMKNHVKAEKLALTIQDKITKDSTLFNLAICFKQDDLQRAIAIANELKEKNAKNSALQCITGTCADRGDFNAATELALKFKSSADRFQGLHYILRNYYNKDKKKAKAWFKTLPEGDRKDLKSILDELEDPSWRMRRPGLEMK